MNAQRIGLGTQLATSVLIVLVLALPLMMGVRTPLTLTASLLMLSGLAFLAGFLALFPVRNAMPSPSAGWIVFLSVFTATVILHIWPSPTLAALFGPYPEALWRYADFEPRTWSPDVGATLRGWVAFIALFTMAWIAYSLRSTQRNWLWLALAVMALFQATYGVVAHATGVTDIFGLWPRNTPRAVHGTLSNYNLFAAYLALLWPLTVAVWWIRGMPLLGRLPPEVKLTGSLISGAVIAAAIFASTSRLGSTGALVGVLVGLLLWQRLHRQSRHERHAAWLPYLVLAAGLMAAAWYGLTPLAERLLGTGLHDARFQVGGVLLHEVPWTGYLHGIGLAGFESMYLQFKPSSYWNRWFDYAHTDLLQWWVEMGLVGLILLATVIVTLIRRVWLTPERIALYAGLAALAFIGLGDFSWHNPATQAVLALFIGVLLQPPRRRQRRRLAGSEGDPDRD